MASHLYPVLRPFLSVMLKIKWNSDEIVPNLGLPILFVCGDQDEIVPYEQTLELHKLASKSVFTELMVV